MSQSKTMPASPGLAPSLGFSCEWNAVGSGLEDIGTEDRRMTTPAAPTLARIPTAEWILYAACRVVGATPANVIYPGLRRKSQPIVLAKTLFCGMAREMWEPQYSYPELAMTLGLGPGAHSTAIYAARRWAELADDDVFAGITKSQARRELMRIINLDGENR